jgi:D-alanyl-D-alanine carboxypeptidase/D-alanyl-D-alanine-endopeptidase (penicillin-binding protein 4)
MTPVRTRRARPLVLLTGLALLLLLVAPGVASANLASRISAALDKHGMAGSGTSAAVFDLTTKEYLYELRPDTPRVPASNEKLVTSSTALASWTATHRFSTQVFLDASPDADGVVQGNVYLRGLGDPTFSTESFAERHWGMETGDVQDLVRGLRALGVTRVTGSVMADEGYFDSLRKVTNWRSSVLAYCSPLSALTLNESYSSTGGYVDDPALGAARTLTKRLRAAGIRVVHAPGHAVAPITATLACTERSATLGRVLAAMNKPSDNFLAEELLKGLGASFGGAGTTAAGARVADSFLQGIGVDDEVRLRDGSGLSYQDRLTAHAILKILGEMARRPDFPVFRRSLAIAGVDGTLDDRMRGTAAAGNVRAKTGTLNVASSLSGYVTAANGHQLTFSLLMNGDPVDVTAAHAAQDAVAVLLARSTP